MIVLFSLSVLLVGTPPALLTSREKKADAHAPAKTKKPVTKSQSMPAAQRRAPAPVGPAPTSRDYTPPSPALTPPSAPAAQPPVATQPPRAEAVPRRGRQAVRKVRRARCTTYRGETVCGFGCKTAYNTRRCAQTPAGVCYAANGEVVCWDPPSGIGNVPGADKACCFERVGDVHCGYNCVESGRDMKCSSFPTGVCQEHRGEVKCWDPEPMWAVGPTKAECIPHNGELVCGYSCVKRAGDAQCAQTPNGVCHVTRGTIACWDPPPA